MTGCPRIRHLPSLPALLALLLAGAALTPGPVRGQTPHREPLVVELPVGSRATALGGAYQLGAPDPDVLFHNPALLDRASGMMLGVQRLGSTALGFTASAATAWFGGAVGVGMRAVEHGTAEPGGREGGLDPLIRGDGSGGSDLAGSVGYALTVAGLRVGAAGTLVAQRWAEVRSVTASVDVGLAHDVGPLMAGLSVRNIGPDRDIGPQDDVPQPLEVTLGLGGYGRPVGPLDVGGAVAVTRRDDGEILVGGGLELGYWPIVGRTFVARIGGRSVPEGSALPVTLGGAYWGDDLVLEYAWQPMDDLDGVHRISVGWR